MSEENLSRRLEKMKRDAASEKNLRRDSSFNRFKTAALEGNFRRMEVEVHFIFREFEVAALMESVFVLSFLFIWIYIFSDIGV